MFRSRNVLWVTLLLAPLVLLASCGDDDKDNGTQPATIDVPDLPAAEVATDVQFNSTEENALAAESIVESQLSTAQAMASMGQAYLGPLGAAQWNDAGSDTWTYTYTYAGCTWTYEVSEQALAYQWTMTYDGDCGGEQVFDDWVALRGTTTHDAREGTMRLYEENTEIVGMAWTWDIAGDDASGSWLFYEGDISTGELVSRLDWVENTDGSEDVTWTWYEQSKFVTHFNAAGNAGWMDLYEWSGGLWALAGKIVWNGDGSGYWASYDGEGNETERLTWTS